MVSPTKCLLFTIGTLSILQAGFSVAQACPSNAWTYQVNCGLNGATITKKNQMNLGLIGAVNAVQYVPNYNSSNPVAFSQSCYDTSVTLVSWILDKTGDNPDSFPYGTNATCTGAGVMTYNTEVTFPSAEIQVVFDRTPECVALRTEYRQVLQDAIAFAG